MQWMYLQKNKMLPKNAITEFIKIYRREYGEILNTEDATQKANGLILLFKEFKKIPPPTINPNKIS